MSEPKELYVGLKEISFYKFDEDGNEVLNLSLIHI